MKRAAKRKVTDFVYMARDEDIRRLASRPHGLAHNGGWWKKRQSPRARPV